MEIDADTRKTIVVAMIENYQWTLNKFVNKLNFSTYLTDVNK